MFINLAPTIKADQNRNLEFTFAEVKLIDIIYTYWDVWKVNKTMVQFSIFLSSN